MHACTQLKRRKTNGQANCFFKLLLGTNIFEINENTSRPAVKHLKKAKRSRNVMSTSRHGEKQPEVGTTPPKRRTQCEGVDITFACAWIVDRKRERIAQSLMGSCKRGDKVEACGHRSLLRIKNLSVSERLTHDMCVTTCAFVLCRFAYHSV